MQKVTTEEVVALAKEGLSAKEIGTRLRIQAQTVYIHLRKVGIKPAKKYTLTKKKTGHRRLNYEAIREYYAEGHSAKETALEFETSENYVKKLCSGIRSGNQYTNGLFDREANAIKCITERAPNFEYVGGFTNTDGFVDVRCKTCGTVLHKSLVTIRHRHATCEECARRESARKREEQTREREAREREKWLSKVCVQRTMTVCPCCGVLFLSSNGRRYCSDTCAKRVMYALGKDKRIKKIRNAIVDRGITLKRLYERDNGRCYICGRVCDWSDCEDRNGVFIAHDNYPSIDHVIPLSKGGLHAWDNVRLACRGCNTRKRDAISPPSCEIA